jgi:hypothetical protein
LIYNNVFLENQGDAPDDGLITIEAGTGGVVRIYNNTFVGGGGGNAMDLGGPDGSGQIYDVRNNLDVGTGTFIYIVDSGSVNLTADYNDGYGLLAGQQYSYSNSSSGAFDTFPQWQALGFDTHGSAGNPNLSATYIPQPTSAAINTGQAMTTYFNVDKAGLSRPQGTSWCV